MQRNCAFWSQLSKKVTEAVEKVWVCSSVTVDTACPSVWFGSEAEVQVKQAASLIQKYSRGSYTEWQTSQTTTAETNKLVEHEETRDKKTLDDTGEQRGSGNQGGKHSCLKMEHRVETMELIRRPEAKLTTTQTDHGKWNTTGHTTIRKTKTQAWRGDVWQNVVVPIQCKLKNLWKRFLI